MARSMIPEPQSPLEVWGEAVNTAAYLHQHTTNKGLTGACMMASYLHDPILLRRICNPEQNTVKAQWMLYLTRVYTMTGQTSRKRLPKLTYSVYRKKKTHIDDVDASGTDEGMAHGCNQDTGGTGESMSHGYTEEVACRPVPGNPAVAGAHSDRPFAGHCTHGHGDRCPPASGVNNGHTHTYIAPDENANTQTDNGHSGHCPTLESHQAASRDEVITQTQFQWSVTATTKWSIQHQYWQTESQEAEHM